MITSAAKGGSMRAVVPERHRAGAGDQIQASVEP